MKFRFYLIVIVVISKCVATDFLENHTEDTLEEIYGRVVHASVIFRHGDRTPYAPYPLDPYKNYVWSEGYGHLTKTGKEKLYNLGKWFRKRYNHLIGEKYSSDEVLIQSSDFDRTLMSAGAFLAGFYPPTKDELWTSDDLKWQPIPVHSIPLEHDNLIAMFKMCNVYNQELFMANYVPKFKAMFKTHEIFFNYVGLNTGIVFSEFFIGFGLMKLMEVYDSLNVQQKHNLPLPEWTESVFPEPMASLALKLYDLATYTDKMKRLKAGPFLKSLKGDMNNKMQENLEKSLHFYSGHDASLAMIMITLGIFNDILPPYGSALMFELRKKDLEYYVTVLFRNSTENPPYLLELPNCGPLCTFENFYNITEPYTTYDWNNECSPNLNTTLSKPDTWPFNTGQTVFLLLVLTFISSTMLYFNFQRNKEKYLKYFCKNNKLKET